MIVQRIKKVLIVLLATASLATVLFGWWQGSGQFLAGSASDLWWLAIGRLAGLLAVWAVLTQVMLTSRATWLETTFGLDRLTHFHHLNGFVALVAIIAHGPLIVLGYSALTGQGFVQQYLEFLSSTNDFLFSSLAVLLFVAIVVASIIIVKRRLRYETWYTIHLATYLAILLAYFHQLEFGGDFLANNWFAQYWIGLYIFVIVHVVSYRIALPFYRFWRHRCQVSAVTMETLSTVSITMTGRHLDRLPWRAGQFVIVRFLAKGFWYESHPFSLSCSPNGDHLRLTVRMLGDFTKKLKNLPVGTPVLLSGPHGAFTPEQATRDQAVLIAGGIGITPLRPIAEALLAQGKRVTLVYANRSADDIPLRQEIETLASRGLDVHYVMSHDATWTGEQGYVDWEKLKRLTPDLTAADIFLCGPPTMMRSVRAALRRLGVSRQAVHFEKFSLG